MRVVLREQIQWTMKENQVHEQRINGQKGGEAENEGKTAPFWKSDDTKKIIIVFLRTILINNFC